MLCYWNTSMYSNNNVKINHFNFHLSYTFRERGQRM